MKDQDYILFDAYLANEMSKEDLADFEARLKNDPQFNQAFTTYKELGVFLEHKFKNEAATKAFEENLKKISSQHFGTNEAPGRVGQQPKSLKTNFYKYAIAACVVLFLGLFVLNQFSAPTYSDYAQHDPISLSVRGQNDALLKTAETAFNNKEFEKAEAAFASLLESDPNNLELQFYRAISNIELDNFKTADTLLEQLKNGNSVYKHKAAWYLALSKLKQDNKPACLEILKTIPQEADDYKRAQKLIKKLN